VLVSHQAGDLQAVADRILVLRLGRVHDVFDGDVSYEDLLAAMTGAVRPGAKQPNPHRTVRG
jgi:D-xylose transport system ATP-binding protein